MVQGGVDPFFAIIPAGLESQILTSDFRTVTLANVEYLWDEHRCTYVVTQFSII